MTGARWRLPKYWRTWAEPPVYAGNSHHWDLYVGELMVYGVRRGTREKSVVEQWQGPGYIKATKPSPELIAKISAMRMML